MKKTLNGMQAYIKLRTAELPERTESYTPIPHLDVINKIKQQIVKSGFVISGENYNCSGDGNVGVGSFGIVFKDDPDIRLALNFLNSYNKTYAFRLAMGGQLKDNNIPFLLNDASLGHFKRLHTGAADLLSSDKISEMIMNADSIWNTLYSQKEKLKSTPLSDEAARSLMMKLFLEDKLTTFQLNYVKKELKEMFKDSIGFINGWAFYKTLLLSVSEAHPTTWINDMIHVHGEMLEIAGISEKAPKEEPAPVEDQPMLNFGDILREIEIVPNDSEETQETQEEEQTDFDWDQFETDDYLDEDIVTSEDKEEEEVEILDDDVPF